MRTRSERLHILKSFLFLFTFPFPFSLYIYLYIPIATLTSVAEIDKVEPIVSRHRTMSAAEVGKEGSAAAPQTLVTDTYIIAGPIVSHELARQMKRTFTYFQNFFPLFLCFVIWVFPTHELRTTAGKPAPQLQQRLKKWKKALIDFQASNMTSV